VIQPIGEYGIFFREKRQPISGVEVGALPAGSVAGLPPIVQGAGGLVRLADLFYDILVLDEENDAHRPVASFDRLRTGLGQVRGSTSYIFWISPPAAGKPCPVLAVLFG